MSFGEYGCNEKREATFACSARSTGGLQDLEKSTDGAMLTIYAMFRSFALLEADPPTALPCPSAGGVDEAGKPAMHDGGRWLVVSARNLIEPPAASTAAVHVIREGDVIIVAVEHRVGVDEVLAQSFTPKDRSCSM